VGGNENQVHAMTVNKLGDAVCWLANFDNPAHWKTRESIASKVPQRCFARLSQCGFGDTVSNGTGSGAVPKRVIGVERVEKHNFAAKLFRNLCNVRHAVPAAHREVNRKQYLVKSEQL
jgi:hypothetical protein